MGQEEILIEIAMTLGELKADMAIVKADVAGLKAAPGKKADRRRWVWTAVVGFLGLIVTSIKAFAR